MCSSCWSNGIALRTTPLDSGALPTISNGASCFIGFYEPFPLVEHFEQIERV
jgi:hypothetical protein